MEWSVSQRKAIEKYMNQRLLFLFFEALFVPGSEQPLSASNNLLKEEKNEYM